MEVEVWSDIVCPWCYIGEHRLRSVIASEGRDDVVVVGRSFELDPTAAPSTGRTLPELLASKYGLTLEEARAANSHVTAVAASEGLEYRLERARPGNTFPAHRILQLAAQKGRREVVAERFFRAYFTEGEAVGELGTVRRLALEGGLAAGDVDRVLGSEEFAEEVRREERRARELGARGVPFFRFPDGLAISGAQPAEVFRAALRRFPPSAPPRAPVG